MSPETQRPIPDVPGYGQLCPMGFALDAIGDRWTVLVLRDLARADLRFGDLQAINPGMSPNLLTTRLRKLEAAGLVERRAAPHPASGTVYALTADTRDAVMPVLTATANLGAFLIDRLPLEQLAAMDLQTALAHQMQLNGHFAVARRSELVGYIVVDLGGFETHITVAPGRFDADPIAPDGAPDPVAVMRVFPPTIFMRMMARTVDPAEAEAQGFLQIEGDRAAALELVRILSFRDES